LGVQNGFSSRSKTKIFIIAGGVGEEGSGVSL
jgi:hypothetical protein